MIPLANTSKRKFSSYFRQADRKGAVSFLEIATLRSLTQCFAHFNALFFRGGGGGEGMEALLHFLQLLSLC